MSIGPDANAETSYDDTQYTLRVPTDVSSVLDRALLVLEDWAQGASFDQSGIDHERGIVLSNGGCISARASARRTRSAACSSKDPVTRIGRRSATPTSSSTRSVSN